MGEKYWEKKKKLKKKYKDREREKEKMKKSLVNSEGSFRAINSINCVWTVIHLLLEQNRFPCTFAATFAYKTGQFSHHAIMLPVYSFSFSSLFLERKRKRRFKKQRELHCRTIKS